jgi:hypothetical protein
MTLSRRTPGGASDQDMHVEEKQRNKGVIMPDVAVKNLDSRELSWTALDGSKRTAVKLRTVFVGRGTYLPGWKRSDLEGKKTGKTSQAHIGYIVSGRMIVKGVDGKEVAIGPGDAFEVTPGHDAWVVGKEPCVALDFGNLT